MRGAAICRGEGLKQKGNKKEVDEEGNDLLKSNPYYRINDLPKESLQSNRWNMASSSNSPCATSKFLRGKCQSKCAFAPYLPSDQPQKFANIHKVFGASNVTKLLNELHPSQREDAVNSLAYEADMRPRDPVYGCVGVISLLQHQLCQLQMDLSCAKSELSKYQNLEIITTITSSFQGINCK